MKKENKLSDEKWLELSIKAWKHREKEMVKIAIIPMISSLDLMENANSESEVLGIGISLIALNLGMYVGIPAVVIIGIRAKF